MQNPDPLLKRVAEQQFYNISKLDFAAACWTTRPTSPATSRTYISGFSPGARRLFEKFEFEEPDRPARRGQPALPGVSSFADIDLHPEAVSNQGWATIYEELIRRFSELSNETAGEHFTPREVIRLMVNLLFIEDDDVLTTPGVVRRSTTPPAAPAACSRWPRTTCAT